MGYPKIKLTSRSLMRTGLLLSFQAAWLLPTACFTESATASPTVQQNTEYDLVVIEATPGGVACAVRAAREGLNVALVNRTEHLGGILSNGLGVWDTLWEGKRSPVYDELRQSIFDVLTAAVAIYDKSRLDNWPDPPRALHTWTIPRTKDEPCPRCGGPMAVIRVRARSTWFCTGCQGEP